MTRAYQVFDLTRPALATAHACGAISLAGPPVLMDVTVYADAGGPLEHLRLALIE